MGLFLKTSRIIGALALVSALWACSALRLAYNQAPELAYWWLNGYANFNELQSPKVREDLGKLFAWHRNTELPKLAALLQKSGARLAGPVSPAQACSAWDETRALMDNLIERALPAAAELAQSLTPEQWEAMQARYKKGNDEYQRDFLAGSPQERHAKRLKNAVERSERLYGRLDEAQLAAVRRSLDQSSFDPQRSYAERLRRQQDALDTLRKLQADKAGPAQAQAALRAYLQRSLHSPDPRYRAYAQQLVQEGCQSFAEVHNSTSTEQRESAVATLKGYESDVRVLVSSK